MNRDPIELDCEACETRCLAAADIDSLLADPGVARHLGLCGDCGALAESLKCVKAHLDAYEVPGPSEEIVRAAAQLARKPLPIPAPVPALPLRAPAERPSRESVIRILAAGLVALPLVALVDLATGWAFYEIVAHILPHTIALYYVGVFAAWATLGASLGYATLPFVSLVGGGFRARASVPSS